MIALPADWIIDSNVGSLVASSPQRTMSVRYRTRIAPLRPVAVMVEDAVAASPEWRTATIGPRERLVTREGEYAFAVALTGTLFEHEAHRHVAVIYGDDYMNVLDAIAIGDEPIAALFRSLVERASLALGSRARRYFHIRPEGWFGRATGLVTHWFPEEYPARRATIVVYPATPSQLEPTAVFDALLAHELARGTRVDPVGPPATFAARHELAGLHWTVACTPARDGVVHRDLVVLAQDQMTYTLQLDIAHRQDPRARATFLALARTVEPVPSHVRSKTEVVFQHYSS